MNLSIGTKIYYTGDRANASANCTIVDISKNYVSLSEINGNRTFHIAQSQIGNVYQGHGNPRFVTEEARQAYLARLTDRTK